MKKVDGILDFSVRTLFVVLLIGFSVTGYSYGQKALPVTGYNNISDGILLHLKPGMMEVQILSPSIIHIVYTPGKSFTQYPKLAVLDKKWEKAKWHVNEANDYLDITTDSLKVRVNKKTGSLSYYNVRGGELLTEPQGGSMEMQPATIQGEKTWHATQEFDFSPSEGLYGLGQYQNKLMNYVGHDVLMSQSNRNDVVPFLVSSKGYGILWNNTSQSWFRDTYQGAFWSDVADQIDYYFVYGPKTDRIISGYRKLTGKAPLFGKWVYGYIQSKEHYKTASELIDVVSEYRRRQIPLDVIVQDWHYWGDKGWNTLTFNKKRYAHPKQMMDSLHNVYHAHLLLSVWPKFGDKTAIYKAMKSHGYLYPVGDNYGDFEYDAFNPNARDLYWKWIDKGLFSKGVDSWWLDATEPEIKDASSTRESTARFILLNKHNYLGTNARYLNAYSLMTTTGVYKHQRETTSKKRVFILTRSAFAGQQRNAAATWSGDTQASWNVLQKQIPAGLNFSLAGIPYWTTDIGAFFVDNGIFPGGSKNKAYRELFVRWFEYGAFCPLFRVHGTDTPREVWRFGQPGTWAYDALVKTDKLRYRLLPYIYSLAWKITNDNYTMMRGLDFDFQNDPKVRNIWNEFMFGPSILVNPVTEPGETARQVYLPSGANWTDFWSGEQYEGGQAIQLSAPIDHIPLLVKQGSIIPMGPVIQYASEKPEDPLELRIYPGANAHFTMYEDEDDNYDYEKGIYSTITFGWDNSSKTLTIRNRKGSFPGMLKNRTIHIVLVNKNHGTGLSVTQKPDKTVIYDGNRISVSF